ncbi:MAG: NAD(P)-dependent alcohol dehydrogenase [Proteobacteria bacterium]|nr:NAD(P)-dependent alcohol dehydrogenase [Cystobacterineae bacterium]MCL2258349.1 NAD(P)-dependent alcohol dehydrogenase [Cystobacterineae bacterium]MCL2315288.1 NAD(P)-dependent alcohol dehydrogenase [Pseudomonadota bacterium]
MKAAICTRYGPPEGVKIENRPKPKPKDNEVLVRVHAATVSSGDCRVRSANVPAFYKPMMLLMFGFRKPRQPVLGTELSGQVEAVGKEVKSFKEGDAVFGMTGMKMGAHAEYIALPENGKNGKLVPKPQNLSHEQAAAISFGGTSALHFLRKGNVQQGKKLLVYGASGAVGTSAVQLAKHFGAEVTGVCSGDNVELVHSLGADCVIDYSVEDFRCQTQQYDIVFDAVGRLSKSSCKNTLSPGGKFITVSGSLASERIEDMQLLKQLAQNGQFMPVIDRTYPLEQIVDAYAYADIGHKKGNVVIAIP